MLLRSPNINNLNLNTLQIHVLIPDKYMLIKYQIFIPTSEQDQLSKVLSTLGITMCSVLFKNQSLLLTIKMSNVLVLNKKVKLLTSLITCFKLHFVTGLLFTLNEVKKLITTTLKLIFQIFYPNLL